MSILYVLCGIPGSGKSTWAQKIVNEHGENKVAWISRDKIRFALIKSDEEYFSHETEVINNFILQIQKAIDDKIPFVIADATHLNRKSRTQLINHLDLHNSEICYVYFDIPLDIALERNAQRQGRAKVPDLVIEKMYYSLTKPTRNVIVIDENGNEKIKEVAG